MDSELKDFTVRELDDVLVHMGLPTDGKKADKIERLKDKIHVETSETGEEPEVKDYEMKLWAGVKAVCVCRHCGRQIDEEENIILHVLKHYPENVREKKFEKLVKEMENG